MRSHVTIRRRRITACALSRFNTASGMRSHVTEFNHDVELRLIGFQYRKRYEVTCDMKNSLELDPPLRFQYRKRYEVTCDFL